MYVMVDRGLCDARLCEHSRAGNGRIVRVLKCGVRWDTVRVAC